MEFCLTAPCSMHLELAHTHFGSMQDQGRTPITIRKALLSTDHKETKIHILWLTPLRFQPHRYSSSSIRIPKGSRAQTDNQGTLSPIPSPANNSVIKLHRTWRLFPSEHGSCGGRDALSQTDIDPVYQSVFCQGLSKAAARGGDQR